MGIKRVLIAHQSTIPPYRIAFYQAMERLRPSWWEFSVIYDHAEAQETFFTDGGKKDWGFPTIDNRNHVLRLGGKRLTLQSFPLQCRPYDLIVVGSAMNNLANPLTHLWRLWGKSVAYWGHGRDYTANQPSGMKQLLERVRLGLSRNADGFFAYTPGVFQYMAAKGMDPHKMYTVHNTIDIEQQRADFDWWISKRDGLRAQSGMKDKKALLFVGRLTAHKHVDYLIDMFAALHAVDDSYYLHLVGGGDTACLERLRATTGDDSFTYHGPLYDDRLSSLYMMSDLYVFPGAVGLGPLQALCFDLTPVVIDAPIHKPEYEYLNPDNAIILPQDTSHQAYAAAIDSLMNDPDRWAQLRAQAWPSIKHLTIENMARNFVYGITAILERTRN